MQPDPGSPQEIQPTESPAPMQAGKAPKRNLLLPILAALVILFLVLAAGGLGYWGYTLNLKLTDAQQQLAQLQGEHDKLKTDYQKSQTDLAAAQAELASTKKDLGTAQADLKDSDDQNKGLQSKISTTALKVKILYTFMTSKTGSDIITIDTLVKSAHDSELQSQWSSFTDTLTPEAGVTFLNYLVGAIQNDLK